MKAKTEVTEILKNQITQSGRESWKAIRRRVFKKILPYIIASLIFIFAGTVMLVLCAFGLEKFIDNIQSTGKVDYKLVIFIVCVIVAHGFIVFGENYLGHVCESKSMQYMQIELFDKALGNDDLMQNVQTGDLVSMFQTDIATLGTNLSMRPTLMIMGFGETAVVLAIIYYFFMDCGRCGNRILSAVFSYLLFTQ